MFKSFIKGEREGQNKVTRYEKIDMIGALLEQLFYYLNGNIDNQLI